MIIFMRKYRPETMDDRKLFQMYRSTENMWLQVSRYKRQEKLWTKEYILPGLFLCGSLCFCLVGQIAELQCVKHGCIMPASACSVSGTSGVKNGDTAEVIW